MGTMAYGVVEGTMGRFGRLWVTGLAVLCGLLGALPLSGCVMVGGYTSGGGWFVWPGSIGLSVILLVLYLVLRRR